MPKCLEVSLFLKISINSHVLSLFQAARRAPLLYIIASRLLCPLVITIVHMDQANQVPAHGLPLGVPRTWAILSERSDVPLATLYYRAHKRQSIKQTGPRPAILRTFTNDQSV